MTKRSPGLCLAVLAGAVFAVLNPLPVSALVNPQVQPRHYYDMFNAVLACEVTSVDARNLTARLSVESVLKGTFAPKEVELKSNDPAKLEQLLALGPGQTIVVFAGKNKPRSGRLDVVYYSGGGKWFKARMKGEESPGQWELMADADEGQDAQSNQILFGTFNGSVENFAALMADFAKGNAYFPARPISRFTAQKIASLGKSAKGVAMVDLNADGRLDLFAASPEGDRVLLQGENNSFTDATKESGVSSSSTSVSVGDADADGNIDLLLNGVLYLQRDGKWSKSAAMPALKDVVSAAFFELDGDGFPDVVVSRKNGGLSVFRNSGRSAPLAFEDWTARSGLDKSENGAGLTGPFELVDWNSDGRTDLAYLAGSGWILINEAGGFSALPLSGDGEEPAFSGAASAPFVHPEKPGLIVGMNDGQKFLFESAPDDVSDITRYGNEIQDDAPGMFAIVAEDLTADGTVDFYAGSREAGSPAFFCMNRGYGSFLLPEKYAAGSMPGEIYNRPVWGIAAGDLDGDGAIDLAVGGMDGTLWVAANETLRERKTTPEAGTLPDERKQIQARHITVRPAGATGIIGAKITLKNSRGEIVASREIGANVGSGSSGPLQATFTVREPGAYTVETRFSDSAAATIQVDLGEAQPRHQVVTVNHPPAG